jgi:hypothetical protein
MTIVRANARHRQLVAAKKDTLDKFAADPFTKCRAVTKVTKMILLNEPYQIFSLRSQRSELYEIKAKSLGAGVYELSLELKE